MAKVVHLTTVHQGLDVRIFHKQAVTLASAGYEVSVVTNTVEAGTRHNVKIIPLPNTSSRWARITTKMLRAYRIVVREQPDICHLHDFELIPLGVALKIRGIKVIYDVHEDVAKDLYDKSYIPNWLKPPLRVAVKLLEWIATKSFDHIVAATEGIAKNFPPGMVTLIRNVPILDELTPPSAVPFANRPRNIIYIGGLAPFNGVEQMVAAMGELPDSTDIRLILGGTFGSEKRRSEIEKINGWSRVKYLGWVGRDKLPSLFASARAGLVVYKPTPNIMECEPNKFFEVLSAGIPIIASNLPHWHKFVDSHQCGVTVNPLNAKEIAQAILNTINAVESAEQMGRNGRMAVVTQFNWDIDGARLVNLYKKLLPGRTTAL